MIVSIYLRLSNIKSHNLSDVALFLFYRCKVTKVNWLMNGKAWIDISLVPRLTNIPVPRDNERNSTYSRHETNPLGIYILVEKTCQNKGE